MSVKWSVLWRFPPPMRTVEYLLTKAPLLITWFIHFAAWSISVSALDSQVLMSANEWEVNLWPRMFDCAVASPPSTPLLTGGECSPVGRRSVAASDVLSKGGNDLTFLLSGNSCSCFIWSHQAESLQTLLLKTLIQWIFKATSIVNVQNCPFLCVFVVYLLVIVSSISLSAFQPSQLNNTGSILSF